jgi:hypothetical protein
MQFLKPSATDKKCDARRVVVTTQPGSGPGDFSRAAAGTFSLMLLARALFLPRSNSCNNALYSALNTHDASNVLTGL